MTQARRDSGVRRQLHELELLFEISQTLDQSPDLREVSALMLQAMAEHMGMIHATLCLLNRFDGELVIEAAYGLTQAEQARGRYRLGEGLHGRVAAEGKRCIVPHLFQDPDFLDRTGARRKNAQRDLSFICVPIRLDNELVGTLSADRDFTDAASLEDDARLLSIIASMIAQAVRLRQQAGEELRQLEEENERLQQQLRHRFHPSNIVGNSGSMRRVYDQIAQVAQSNTTTLICGESGVGKELVAHAVHYSSDRATGPFVRVNCAALPSSVIESELFGHEKGSFTGALAQRKGRFELAHGGTIFLDEVGDFTASTQIMLLRALQEKEFERVGGNRTLKSDVRIIAATNRDLEEQIVAGTFREDLYYRLNVFPIHVPPLRERKSDILLLADYFVEKYGRQVSRNVRRISTSVIDMLMRYHWPGNVRELENCIERAVLIAEGDVLHGRHLPPSLQTAESSDTKFEGKLDAALNSVERDLLVDSLKNARGNMAAAARTLGITERVMGLRIKKHGMDPRRFKPSR